MSLIFIRIYTRNKHHNGQIILLYVLMVPYKIYDPIKFLFVYFIFEFILRSNTFIPFSEKDLNLIASHAVKLWNRNQDTKVLFCLTWPKKCENKAMGAKWEKALKLFFIRSVIWDQCCSKSQVDFSGPKKYLVFLRF